MTKDQDMQQERSAAPIACDLTVFTRAERDAHIERVRQLRQAVRGFYMTSNGVEVSFDATADADEVLAFAEDEQRCCGFISGASGSHEPSHDGENFVLRLNASPDAALAWITGFMALRDDGPFKLDMAARSAKWRIPAAVAGLWAALRIFRHRRLRVRTAAASAGRRDSGCGC